MIIRVVIYCDGRHGVVICYTADGKKTIVQYSGLVAVCIVDMGSFTESSDRCDIGGCSGIVPLDTACLTPYGKADDHSYDE